MPALPIASYPRYLLEDVPTRGFIFTDNNQKDILAWDTCQFSKCPKKSSKPSFGEVPSIFESWRNDPLLNHPLQSLTADVWDQRYLTELRFYFEAPNKHLVSNNFLQQFLNNLSIVVETNSAWDDIQYPDLNRWTTLNINNLTEMDHAYYSSIRLIALPQDFQISMCLDPDADLELFQNHFPLSLKVSLTAQKIRKL